MGPRDTSRGIPASAPNLKTYKDLNQYKQMFKSLESGGKGNLIGWNFTFIDVQGKDLGQVTKKWAGIGKELFTTADNYILQIADDVPPDSSLRILIMAAVMCIDMVLKE